MRRVVSSIITVMFAVGAYGVAQDPAAQDHAAHGTTSLAVTGSDYAYDGPDSIEAGFTSLTFTNAGAEPHHIQLARLKDGVSREQVMAALQQSEHAAAALLEFVGGVGILVPGQSQTVVADLSRPGTYIELCFFPNAAGVPHFALGMTRFFEVTAAAAAAERPDITADLVVRMVDFGYDFPAEIRAGPQVWEVINDGPQPHEMALMKIAEGRTVEEALASLGGPPVQGPPAAVPVGGVQALDVGRSNFVELDLTPGNYVVVCFVGDPESGQPHIALGMISTFTVPN